MLVIKSKKKQDVFFEPFLQNAFLTFFFLLHLVEKPPTVLCWRATTVQWDTSVTPCMTPEAFDS